MYQMKIIQICVLVLSMSYGMSIVAEEQKKADMTPSVVESSQELWKSLGTFFNSVGKEVAEQAQELNKRFASYVDSLKNDGNTLFSIEQTMTEHAIFFVIKGLEHVEETNSCEAHLEYNRQAVADTAIINVGPRATVTISEYVDQNVARNKWTTIAVEADTKKTEEVQEANKMVTKTYEFKSKKHASFLVRQPLNFEQLIVEFDAATKELKITIPFFAEQKKAIQVHVK